MNTIQKIFTINKPIIGMLHLDYLEGKKFKGIDYVVVKAMKDIEALQNGGIDGILIENWKESSVGEFVSEETEKNIHLVVQKLSKHIKIPFGINVLNNDYKVAFSVGKLTGASFIELDVFVDKVKSDFQNNITAIKKPFVIEPKPEKIWEYAKNILADTIPLFVFVQPKHYMMVEKKPIEKSVMQAINVGASAILITKATGIAPTVGAIKRVKKVSGNTSIGIGSGFRVDNASELLPFIDFAVVGTSIKFDQKTDNPVDEKKVKELMTITRYRREVLKND